MPPTHTHPIWAVACGMPSTPIPIASAMMRNDEWYQSDSRATAGLALLPCTSGRCSPGGDASRFGVRRIMHVLSLAPREAQCNSGGARLHGAPLRCAFTTREGRVENKAKHAYFTSISLRSRTPGARALLPATRCQSSGPLEALLSSPALDVRLLTALQVLQVPHFNRPAATPLVARPILPEWSSSPTHLLRRDTLSISTYLLRRRISKFGARVVNYDQTWSVTTDGVHSIEPRDPSSRSSLESVS